jgi:hypothetical protein
MVCQAAGSHATGSDNVVYAATLDGCGGNPDSLYAIDLSNGDGKVVAQSAQGGSVAGVIPVVFSWKGRDMIAAGGAV